MLYTNVKLFVQVKGLKRESEKKQQSSWEQRCHDDRHLFSVTIRFIIMIIIMLWNFGDRDLEATELK